MSTGEGFSPYSNFRFFVFTGDGLSLKSGFTQILCTPEEPLLVLLFSGLRKKKINLTCHIHVHHMGPAAAQLHPGTVKLLCLKYIHLKGLFLHLLTATECIRAVKLIFPNA